MVTVCHVRGSEFPKARWGHAIVVLPTPRFHFGATVLQGDTILIVGGLTSTTQLLPTDIDPGEKNSNGLFSFQIGRTDYLNQNQSPHPTGSIVPTKLINKNNDCMLGAMFGMSCCTLLSNHLLLITGGVQGMLSPISSISSSPMPILAFWVFNRHSHK
jgi:hypothetical protein